MTAHAADPAGRRTLVVILARFAVALALYAAAGLGYRVALGRSERAPLWAVIAATVVVAGALWVLRGPIDRFASRVALGERADGYTVMQSLLRRLASSLPVDEVVPRLAEAAARGRPRAEVRVLLADGSSRAEAWPAQAPHRGTSLTVDVAHHGATVGEIEVDVGPDDVSAFDRKLLDDLAGPAGLALSTVRLTYDLRRREAQLRTLNAALRASNERMRTARQVQQRRIRAELARRVLPHVGAASRLVDDQRPDAVGSARAETERALDELRDISRGIFPPRLLEDGIAASLDGWMQRSGTHVRATVDGEVPDVPAELTTCAYFCAVTLLDALRAAGAHDLGMHLTLTPSEIVLSVTGRDAGRLDDDGLQIVRDRCESFDGGLEPTTRGDGQFLTCRMPLDQAELARSGARP